MEPVCQDWVPWADWVPSRDWYQVLGELLARSSPKIAIAAPYGLGGVPEGTASSIFRSPCESVRACMTAARVEASTGPQIRNRAPVVNATSITPGDIGTAVIGAKGVAAG